MAASGSTHARISELSLFLGRELIRMPPLSRSIRERPAACLSPRLHQAPDPAREHIGKAGRRIGA